MSAIRQLRERAGLTQRELAVATGISQPNISAYENGHRPETAEAVERVRNAVSRRPSELLTDYRDQITEIVKRHKGTAVRVFGSAAAGTDSIDSDLDLLVTFSDGATLLDVAGLGNELEALLGCRVDVVPDSDNPGSVGRRIHDSAVPV